MLKVKDDESSASFAAKFEPSNLSPLGAATPPSIETIQNLTEDTDKEDQQPAQQQTEPDDGDPLIVEPLSKGSPPSEPRRDLVLARPKEVELRQLPPFPSSIMTMMPIQIFSLAIGTFFFWLGYLSLPFVASSSLLWFDVDIIQNVLHLIIGLGGIGLFIEAIFSKSWRDGLFFYNLATAGICLMLGCVGLIPGLSFQH